MRIPTPESLAHGLLLWPAAMRARRLPRQRPHQTGAGLVATLILLGAFALVAMGVAAQLGGSVEQLLCEQSGTVAGIGPGDSAFGSSTGCAASSSSLRGGRAAALLYSGEPPTAARSGSALHVTASAEPAQLATADSGAKHSLGPDPEGVARSASRARGAQVEPVIVGRAVDPRTAPGVTRADLARLRNRLADGDRAGTYLELYRLTGQDIWLMHAQITSYTGIFGGAAVTANYLAKIQNPDRYLVALDTFSRQIAESMLNVVERDVRAGGNGVVPVGRLREQGDSAVWRGKQMGESFPGNGLFFEVWHHGLGGLATFFSRGTLNGLRAVLAGAVNGKRPSEFRGTPGYRVITSDDGRFTTVINLRNGKVEAFYDRDTRVGGVFGQIDDEPLSPTDPRFRERAALWEYMQANQDVERRFDRSLPRPGENRRPALPDRYRGLFPD